VVISGVPSFWHESLIKFNNNKVIENLKTIKIILIKFKDYIFGITLPGTPYHIMGKANNVSYGFTYGYNFLIFI
jgi:hypothetical protein